MTVTVQASVTSYPNRLLWWQHLTGYVMSTNSSVQDDYFGVQDALQELSFLQPVSHNKWLETKIEMCKVLLRNNESRTSLLSVSTIIQYFLSNEELLLALGFQICFTMHVD